MDGKAFAAGLKKCVGALLAIVLFPWYWMRAHRIARRHLKADPRAVARLRIAIAAALGIAAVGLLAVTAFTADNEAGMYRSLDSRLGSAVGEKEYQDQQAAIDARNTQIGVVTPNLATARAAQDGSRAAFEAGQGNRTAWADANATVERLEQTLADAQSDLAKATSRKAELEPNHALYLSFRGDVSSQDDGAVLATIRGSPVADEDMLGKVDRAFAVKDKALAGLHGTLLWIVYPSLWGAFLAPPIFALGRTLKLAFTASDTVGYKPYPAAAAGWFLLFGGFGVPAPFFAAWTLVDIEGRSVEGQIAL